MGFMIPQPGHDPADGFGAGEGFGLGRDPLIQSGEFFGLEPDG